MVDPVILEILVVDEADQMLDMGFIPDVRRILQRLPINRQTLVFSATMPADPKHAVRQHRTVFATENFRFWWRLISRLGASMLPGFRMSSTMISLPPPRLTATASDGQAGRPSAAKPIPWLPEKTKTWCKPSIELSVLKSSSASYRRLTTDHRYPTARVAPGGNQNRNGNYPVQMQDKR